MALITMTGVFCAFLMTAPIRAEDGLDGLIREDYPCGEATEFRRWYGKTIDDMINNVKDIFLYPGITKNGFAQFHQNIW